MNEDVDKNYLASLDRRVSDHDGKLSSIQRDYTEVSHEIKELLNRLNNGLSPSVNKVRDENAEIKSELKDIRHDLSDGIKDMKGMVRETADLTKQMLENFEKGKLAPVAQEVGFMKKTFVYGLVGALIVFAGQRIMGNFWDRLFRERAATAAPAVIP